MITRRQALLAILLAPALLLGGQDKKPEPDMIAPTIKHNPESYTQTYDRVEVTCPSGYEGHFVDTNIGFQWEWNWGNSIMVGDSPGYVVCFRREFMDKIRANPQLLRARPTPPRPA